MPELDSFAYRSKLHRSAIGDPGRGKSGSGAVMDVPELDGSGVPELPGNADDDALELAAFIVDGHEVIIDTELTRKAGQEGDFIFGIG